MPALEKFMALSEGFTMDLFGEHIDAYDVKDAENEMFRITFIKMILMAQTPLMMSFAVFMMMIKNLKRSEKTKIKGRMNSTKT